VNRKTRGVSYFWGMKMIQKYPTFKEKNSNYFITISLAIYLLLLIIEDVFDLETWMLTKLRALFGMKWVLANIDEKCDC